MKLPARLLAPGLALALVFGASACSDDTKDKAKDAAESAKEDIGNAADTAKENAEDAAGAAGARAAAEALRVSLKGNDTADEKGMRSVDAINQAAEDLPGDPEISMVDDGDGDGLDDDGKVQVSVGDQDACLTLPETGEDTQVTGEAC